jgi:hypothetical protein
MSRDDTVNAVQNHRTPAASSRERAPSSRWAADPIGAIVQGLHRGRARKVVGYPPLVDMDDRQRREFHEALARRRQLRGPACEVAGGDSRGGTEPAKLWFVSDD